VGVPVGVDVGVEVGVDVGPGIGRIAQIRRAVGDGTSVGEHLPACSMVD
jgi:hypothetical protein